MFWKKKSSLPVTPDDKAWIDKNLLLLNRKVVPLRSMPTVLPDEKYFDWNFTGSEKDAEFVLKQVGELFSVDVSRIRLNFYSQQPIDFGFGLVTRNEGTGAAGYYHCDDEGVNISIEAGQLKDPSSLIATMAHELSHYVLMILHNIVYENEHENECLTDLAAIAHGFGIFIGNSAFKRSAGFGSWSIGKQGYLPQQTIAYAMASIAIRKGESMPHWVEFLHGDFKSHFRKSLEFLEKENNRN